MIHALLGAVAAVTAPAVLPSGTYRYAVFADGKKTATSTVIVTHDSAAITVRETIAFEESSAEQQPTSTRTLDPTTFATQSWKRSAGAETETITVEPTRATLRSGSKSTTLAAPGAGPAAVFDFFVGEFATLPAMIHATSATHYTEYCACMDNFDVVSIAVGPASSPRPPEVLAADIAIGLTAKASTATLWYDPQTFILRRLDFPKDHIAYIRIE